VLIDMAGLKVELLASRAVWLPQSASLLLADLHLGKARSFRRQALPVPAGTTDSLLERLDRLVTSRPARELILLGDFLHDHHAQESDAVRRFIRWRAERATLRIRLVPGNHDSKAGDPPAECGIEVEPVGLERGGVLLQHEPDPPARQLSIAGHLHPVIRLAGAIDRLRLPCFWLQSHALVLPAFGEFTGGWLVRRSPNDRVFVADGERVFELPADTRPPTGRPPHLRRQR